MTLTKTYEVRPIAPGVAAQLRVLDDLGHEPTVVVDADGGSPLRCCLRASRPGEQLLLVSYAPLRRWAAAHGANPAAYDEVGPVFIHPSECDGPVGDGWPEDFRGQPRVLRGYDNNGRTVGGTIVSEDDDPEAAINELVDDERVAVIHARALIYGCFTFAIEPRR
jgi:hypothetical protein